ncbi:hypothetical protein PoB_007530900 [Plakobranchus ocellatus]|uniref:Uncharacterized protein n=1 Tax=Plakobranchus ocellatus TaxID=259542 RepID=A0AAV4DX61_9GAST|nr:hypothetical protein PoB_007530900 [Plakobranchus ocellatus]
MCTSNSNSNNKNNNNNNNNNNKNNNNNSSEESPSPGQSISEPVHNKVISGFQVIFQARALVAGLEPAAQEFEQSSGWVRFSLCPRGPHFNTDFGSTVYSEPTLKMLWDLSVAGLSSRNYRRPGRTGAGKA